MECREMHGTEMRARAMKCASWLILLSGVALSALLVVDTSRESSASSLARVNRPTSRYETRNIEALRVGDRVLARNPQITDGERATWNEPDWTSWRRVTLHMNQAHGGILEIELIRPASWFRSHNAIPGKFVFLDLAELGARGDALVISTGQCPEVGPGEGQVITGTFVHCEDDQLLDIRFEGAMKTIGVTRNHLFWSADRQSFIQIGEFAVGESVGTLISRPRRLVERTSRDDAQMVYNLEVHAENVYFIGEHAVLVHNTYNARDVIARSERLRGHALERHVGKSIGYLRDRIRREGLNVATSFANRAELEYAVTKMLGAHRGKIKRWVDNPGLGPPNQMRLTVQLDKQVGRGVVKTGRRKFREVNGFRYVEAYIRRSMDSPDGFELITIFPTNAR